MKKIGIIGGGQLGKMMILAGKQLDYQFYILDPTEDCPAHSIADGHIVASFQDIDAMKRLASKVDVITYEFEHISLKALQELEEIGYLVYPSSKTLGYIQNKYTQKQWLEKNQIPVPKFVAIECFEDLQQIEKTFSFPVVLKTCTGGYDGKGNVVIHKKEEIEEAFATLGSLSVPLMVEECIPFEKEISILACRNLQGNIDIFPVAENIHKNSILDETIVPANILEATEKEARAIAEKCLQIFEAVGILCIEFFVTRDGHVLVNELAPRPHNSGHYTIEGCYTSQFQQHIRAILGLPLGNSSLIAKAVMKNIIGDHDGEANVVGVGNAYQQKNVKVHIYGKREVKKNRKMGHITAVGDSIEELQKSVREARDAISFRS